MPLGLAVIFIGMFSSVAPGAIVATGWCKLHSTGIFYDGCRDFNNAMCLTTLGGIVITFTIVIVAAFTGADWFAV